MNKTYLKWLFLMFFSLLVILSLDFVFGTKTDSAFVTAGLIAYVILWCEKQEKNEREK